MRIYIIGFMGAGKTTIGRELARRLEIPFFDLDEMVETAEQMKVKDLFAERGESYFRKRERDILRTTRYLEHGVIATGGGTFTFEENIQFIQSAGLSIYLAAPFSVLRTRIGSKADERPLFRDDRATSDLYQQRLKYYKMSDMTIDTDESETVAEIVERLIMELPKEMRGLVNRRGTRV